MTDANHQPEGSGTRSFFDDLHPGARVEVRNLFDGTWTQGFEIAETAGDDCHIRRISDGSVLPRTFPRHEVRRERRREMWWL